MWCGSAAAIAGPGRRASGRMSMAEGRIHRCCLAVTRALHGGEAAVADKAHCGVAVPEPAPENCCWCTGEG
jgi:hypothetical protein